MQEQRVQSGYNGWLFGFNNEQKLKFRVGRLHLGSYCALLLSIYNTNELRQQIIKQAIVLTRSTKPLVIRITTKALQIVYCSSLFCIWHIPPFAIQLSYSLFYATSYATFNYLNPVQSTMHTLITQHLNHS